MPEQQDGLTLVVALYAHPGQEAGLREFETQAAAVLRDYGGRIEKVIRIAAAVGTNDVPSEIHIVWFPSEANFGAYRSDARLASLAPLRERAIARTSILIGQDAVCTTE